MGDSEIPNKCTRTDTPTGQSLLNLAINFALELTDDVLVTTPKQPPVLPLKRIWWRERPADLCGPDIPMRDVVNDALDWWEAQGKTYDKWVLLQPTTPTRTPNEVKRVIEEAMGRWIVCSVECVPADLSPSRLRYMDAMGRLEPVTTEIDREARQFERPAYRRNGVAYAGTRLWSKDAPMLGVGTHHHQTLDTLDDWQQFVGNSLETRKALISHARNHLGFSPSRSTLDNDVP